MPATVGHRFSDAERVILDQNAKGMLAALVGWTICSLFASVAFNWTFYYLLTLSVAGREVTLSRRAAAPPAHNERASRRVGSHIVRARA